ncbi:MAG: 1-acyl-sn-glycerol-3-phosphate acyltransferase [Bacteroidales bacterium]|nr:1-acyl-sn-glycerol-3-phosphate acyltransferase [Bacteroidales bacterium]
MNKKTTIEKTNNLSSDCSNQITPKFISLERIIASKNKTLYKLTPKFVISWLKKLIHLDEINYVIYKYRDKTGVDFANAVLDELQIKLEVINPENIPTEGRPLVVANHPIGSIDGIALISLIGEKRKDVLFPVNDILCQLPGLKGVFIPINKYGRNSSNHQTLNSAFEGDSIMMFFPAGTESKIIDKKLQDFPWKKSFINEAQKFKRDIVPVYIDGCNSKGFYRLFKIRKFLGIKFDVEMILLPREMFNMRGQTLKLTFAKPIPIDKITKEKHHSKIWADKIRSFVYELKDNKDAVFNTED